MKKIFSIILSLVFVLTSIGTFQGATEVKAEDTLSNPRVSNGITTWDCIYLGECLQEDTSGDKWYVDEYWDKKQPIKWRVLSVDYDRDDIFVMSEKILNCMLYSDDLYGNPSWEKCDIRQWLNNYFLSTCFTYDEQRSIKDTSTGERKNEQLTDKIFLLSLDEVTNENYGFSSELIVEDPGRVGIVTQYAKQKWNQSSIDNPDGRYPWFLRSYKNQGPVIVSTFGWIDDMGETGYKPGENYGVRPAMHLKLSDYKWTKAETVSSPTVESITTPTSTPTPTPTSTPVGSTSSPIPTSTTIFQTPTSTPTPAGSTSSPIPTSTTISQTPTPTSTPTPVGSTSSPIPTSTTISQAPTPTPTPAPTQIQPLTPLPIVSTSMPAVNTLDNSTNNSTNIKYITNASSNDESSSFTKLAKVKKLKAKSWKKQKIKLSWKKVKKATKYQIRYSNDKNLKKRMHYKNSKKTKATLKNVKKGKYYIQVRALQTRKKTTYAGAWSTTKKIVVK